MLNLFPIQWLALFAYAILRLFVSGVLVVLGFRHLHLRNEIAAVTKIPFWPFPRLAIALMVTAEIISGTLILVGFYTQVGALILVLLCLKMIVWHNYIPHPGIPSRLMYVLLLGCGLSLFITGAGVLAFDLPI